MAGTAEPVEAVIISGSRRGEIVLLPEGLPSVSDDDVSALNEALDELIAAVDRVSLEVRVTTAALKSSTCV